MAVTADACFPLGTEKHVFVDWNIVEPGYGVAWAGSLPGAWEMPSGIELAVHKPRVDDGPFISADKPWEATVGSHGVVFEDEGVYRFYYRMRTRDGGDDGSHPMILAYAESTDGVTWTKPSIGTVELDGSKDNNLVYGLNVARGRSVNSASVFKDPTSGPNERYKLLYRDPTERQSPNLYGAVSPDGLRWETLDEPLITNYFSDTHNVVGYDPRRGQYVAYVRGWTEFGPGALHGRRTIAHAASDTNDLRRGRSGRAGHGHLHERLHSLAGRRRLPDVPGVLPKERRHRRDPNAHGTGRSDLGAPDSGADGARRGAGNAFGGWLLRRLGSRELPARRGLAAYLRDLAHSQRGSLRRNTDIRHTWRTLVDRNLADGRLCIAGGAGRGQLRDGAHHVRGRSADDKRLDPVRR